MQHSGTNLEYTDETGKKFIPHIWEISAGVDRTLYAVLENSMKEGKEGLYLALNPCIAPYSFAIFPLINKEKLPELAKEVENILKDEWLDVFYDSGGSIGRRYARADEIGIPFCITIDFDSLKKKDVTIRERDTGKQVRVKISELKDIVWDLVSEEIPFAKAGKKVK
jgi:glycyl-tRNA synthetase